MRKLIAFMLTLCLLALASGGALAAGVTLRAFTPFADVDFAAQGYNDLITAWESESGNVVEDYSGAMDEMWMAQMLSMVVSGEADVVVLPLGSGLTAEHLVTADELIAAAPESGAKRFASMAEEGDVLLAPVRLNWEALYVNTDVLARFGLEPPQTFEELIAVCMILSQSGVTPIANALCEWPEIVLDCAALSGAPQELYGQQASLDGALDVLTVLTQVDAFGSDPWNASDADMEQKFLSGEAAMRIDADGLAQMIDPARAGSVVVVPLPAKDGAPRTAACGTPAFGVAITRACWQDDARCEAAVSFVTKLLGTQALVSPAEGALGNSIAALTANAQDCAGLLYDFAPDTFDAWAEGVIASLMSL